MAEQYIFNGDTEKHFYEKLDSIHDTYVMHLMMSGVAEKGMHIEDIKMVKNPNTTMSYCKKLVGGLTHIKPSVIARLVEDKITRLECIFTKIRDGGDYFENDLFMIQNVIDYPKPGKFSCQIWYLGEATTKQIEDHWYE